MRVYVALTDGEWYRYLAERSASEVNFWQPAGGRQFRALDIGEPFLFKTHYPENKIVGGGFFSGFVGMTVSEAWELFGEGNGCDSLDTMRRRIRRYRRDRESSSDPAIGCVLLRDVMFFPSPLAEPAPSDFAKNIVQGKTYDTSAGESGHYIKEVLTRLVAVASSVVQMDLSWAGSKADIEMFGLPRLVRPRLGQQSFRAMVMNAYSRRCAVTGAKIRPVLEAAHIRPVEHSGEHRLDNGLLLRSDVHTLFDRGYLGVDSKYRLMVSPLLRQQFDNGNEFYTLKGSRISLPSHRTDRPNHDFLEWHADTVFLAS
ncbi:MAG: HNH endonuclease [Pseudonocardiaceae bacterium]|nr:HNH endonuclease [Pseudonocardiaceae bacterium]